MRYQVDVLLKDPKGLFLNKTWVVTTRSGSYRSIALKCLTKAWNEGLTYVALGPITMLG